MRGLVEGSPEEPQEVVARKARLAGDLFQIERLVIAFVDELASAEEALIRVRVRRRSRAVDLIFTSFHRHPQRIASPCVLNQPSGF
jgi:hypothetical protein